MLGTIVTRPVVQYSTSSCCAFVNQSAWGPCFPCPEATQQSTCYSARSLAFPALLASLLLLVRLLVPLSCEDLALPAVAGVLFHGTWTFLIAGELSIIGLPDACPQRAWASSSILWLLASFGLTTVLQVWVTAASLRGAAHNDPQQSQHMLAAAAVASVQWVPCSTLVHRLAVDS